jgi:DNA-binding NarL/FixJ family response regulator
VPPIVASKLAEYAPRVDFTVREMEVLQLMAQGLSNKEIAQAIGRTEATVKTHVLHLLAKLGEDDRTGAVTVALKRGLIHLT